MTAKGCFLHSGPGVSIQQWITPTCQLTTPGYPSSGQRFSNCGGRFPLVNRWVTGSRYGSYCSNQGGQLQLTSRQVTAPVCSGSNSALCYQVGRDTLLNGLNMLYSPALWRRNIHRCSQGLSYMLCALSVENHSGSNTHCNAVSAVYKIKYSLTHYTSSNA